MNHKELEDRVWALLLELPSPKAPFDFEAKVWLKIKEQEAKSQSPIWLPKLAWAFGGLLLIWSLGLGAGTSFYVHQVKSQKAVLTPIIRLTKTTPVNSLAGVYQRRQ